MEEEDMCGSEESGCFQPPNMSYNGTYQDLQDEIIVGHNNDTGDMTFQISKHLKETMKMMFMMRSHHMLTDVILEVGTELLHAHKVVLAAASPYFKAMFTGGLKECEMSRIKLHGVCPTSMTKLMYFMYTGQIRVTEVTVCTLLPAATMLQVTYVIQACCKFLEKQLEPTNAIGIANFAEQHGCIDLHARVNQYILQNFTKICQGEEFLQLSALRLISLVRKDELNVKEEREVYNAVLKWVKYNEEARGSNMEHILQAVRCQHLSPEFLKEQVKNCDILKKVPACRRYLAQIFKDLTLHKKPIVKERIPYVPRIIYVAGGLFTEQGSPGMHNGRSLSIFEGYNVDKKTWTKLENLLVPRSGLGCAFLKGMLYAVGGRCHSLEISSNNTWVDKYNPLKNIWRPCSPMSVPRNRVGVAVLDGLLYAVGGSAGSEYLNTVERYDPDEDTWTYIQPMHCKRLGVGVAVVKRLLYAFGGFDGEVRLNSVERYNPQTDTWKMMKPMKFARSGPGIASLGQYIYIVGGYDRDILLSSVERYDTERNVWEEVQCLTVARSAMSLSAFDGKLYAMGGFNGKDVIDTVEIYDPARDVWKFGVPMLSCRSGHSSAVSSYQYCNNHSD